MKTFSAYLFAWSLWALSGTVFAGVAPNVGFVYPAGAQQGTVIEASIGGQYFSDNQQIFVSGDGVSVELLRYSVKYETRKIGQMFRNQKNAQEGLKDKQLSPKEIMALEKRLIRSKKEIALIELPDSIDRNDQKAIFRYYRSRKKEQFNPQLADRVQVRITVDKNAPLGKRELRVYTESGLSNPFYFEVGSLPEINEIEPNDDHLSPDLELFTWPCIINGQIVPGDMDHFNFKAQKGDSIVVDVRARRIIPYLADAVPGWFQAIVALYDEDGNEVAYQDDYQFNPDPVLFFEVPNTGVYTLSVRDSIYRGREDFIYRIAVGELPFITSIFPLGAQRGQDVDIALSGWNLPKKRLAGNLPQDESETKFVSVKKDQYTSNEMPFMLSNSDEIIENEPNDTPAESEKITDAVVINGRIQTAGDCDVYTFDGNAGDWVGIEVTARRLNSPLDSVVSLIGPNGDLLASNDDNNQKDRAHLHFGAGLITHHADSQIQHELKETGTYFVEIRDTQGKGGRDYGYRLRIGPIQPDFKLRLEPSGLPISPGASALFSIRVERLQGFDGEITLSAENLPSGFLMSAATIGKEESIARITITAPEKIIESHIAPKIFGSAIVGEITLRHCAEAVDNQMQAFLYRHLVPAESLILAPVSQPRPITFEAVLPKTGVLLLESGRVNRVALRGFVLGKKRGYSVILDAPPAGVELAKKGWIGKKRKGTVKKEPTALGEIAAGNALLRVDESVAPGTLFNLVLSAEVRKGKEKTYYPAPAIPVKIIAPRD